MSSKTGWTATIIPLDELVRDKRVVRDELPGANLRRVCVRVDPCPETIARSELATTIKRGWEIKVRGWGQGSFIVTNADVRVHTEVGLVDWEHIILVRPHSAAEWTKVEEG